MTPGIPPEKSRDNPEIEGRRQLLKMAAYVPPAMLGVMISASKMAEAAPVGTTQNCGNAGVIVISANGNACCPCVPGSNQYNLNTCNLNRCQLGNCTACNQVVFTSRNQCRSAPAACNCRCRRQGRRRNRTYTC